MKQLARNTCPDKLNNLIYKQNLYNNLRDEKGKIYARWNTIMEKGKKVVREQLKSISGECCCFCGDKVSDSKMDVDHFLPSSVFPYLSYCWDNLLPTCKQCNQTFKGDYAPSSLKNLIIVESCMSASLAYDHIYDKATILAIAKDDRIIDPTFDTVVDHLNFNPEFFMYHTQTKIGVNTNEMFFDRAEVLRELEGCSKIAKGFVEDGCPRNRIDDVVELIGYEFYFNSFYDYWLNEKAEGRLR